MPVHVFLKTGFQRFEQFFPLFRWQALFVHVSRSFRSHRLRVPRFLPVMPLLSARSDLFRLVFAFYPDPQIPRRPERTGQHILARCRQANMRVSHLPQPPGIGRKIPGASSTNAACCSASASGSRSLRLARPAKQISCRRHETPARLHGGILPRPPGPGRSCESRQRSSADARDYGVSHHHRRERRIVRRGVSARQLRVHRFRKRDVVAVGVSDHHGLDLVARMSCCSCRCAGFPGEAAVPPYLALPA